MWYTKSNFIVSNIYKGISRDYMEPQFIVEVAAVGLFKVMGEVVLTIETYENVNQEVISKVKKEIIELMKEMNLI